MPLVKRSLSVIISSSSTPRLIAAGLVRSSRTNALTDVAAPDSATFFSLNYVTEGMMGICMCKLVTARRRSNLRAARTLHSSCMALI